MEEYVGMIKLFAGNYAPQGWALCNGQLLLPHRYQNLFSVIGTIYGGDGTQSFALPDLRGRVPLGVGAGQDLTSYKEGEKGGAENAKVELKNMPAHKHGVHLHANSEKAAYSVPVATSVLAAPGRPEGRAFEQTFGYSDTVPNVQLSDTSVTMDEAGTGEPFKIVQPFIAMNYVICLEGIYPPRS